MLSAYEKHKQNYNSFLPYEFVLIAQIDEVFKILEKCQFVAFNERPNKIYLRLNPNATSDDDVAYKKLSGENIFLNSLDTLCDYYGVSRKAGYRVANLSGHVELLPDLLKYFGPKPKKISKPKI